MDLTEIKAITLPDAWFQCVWNIQNLKDGVTTYTIDKGSYKEQKRLEFDYITIHIQQPGVRPLIPEMPEYLSIPAPCDKDMVDAYFLNYINPYSTHMAMNEQYTYSQRIEISYDKIIENFKTKGFGSNQEIIQVGAPKDINLPDPPCLRHIDCRIRDGKLHFIIYFRSWDLWGGFPANLAALQLLKELMAQEIGIEDGEIICSSKGLHLYDHVWELAKLRIGK